MPVGVIRNTATLGRTLPVSRYATVASPAMTGWATEHPCPTSTTARTRSIGERPMPRRTSSVGVPRATSFGSKLSAAMPISSCAEPTCVL